MVPILLLLLLLACPSITSAESAISCHCFQDRSYDPARPQAADGYFLANLHNSLFAGVTGMPKRELVSSLMGGGSGTTLWIEWYLVVRGGLDAEVIGRLRSDGQSWRDIAKQQRLPLDQLSPEVVAELVRGRSDEAVASAIINEVLISRLAVKPSILTDLRRAGGTDREVIAVSVLSRRLNIPSGDLLRRIRSGDGSWSSWVTKAGIDGKNAEGTVKGMLSP